MHGAAHGQLNYPCLPDSIWNATAVQESCGRMVSAEKVCIHTALRQQNVLSQVHQRPCRRAAALQCGASAPDHTELMKELASQHRHASMHLCPLTIVSSFCRCIGAHAAEQRRGSCTVEGSRCNRVHRCDRFWAPGAPWGNDTCLTGAVLADILCSIRCKV